MFFEIFFALSLFICTTNSLTVNPLDYYCISNIAVAEKQLSIPDEASYNIWPSDAPSERPGQIGPEFNTCLTPATPIAQCKGSLRLFIECYSSFIVVYCPLFLRSLFMFFYLPYLLYETDISVHNVTVPTLTPFLVENATSAMIIAPGGGYSILAFNREGTDIAAWLNSIGISAFVLKYRVPSRSWIPFGSAPLMDAQRSLGLVRQMAAEGKIDGLDNSSQIGFMGFSAGAHLTGHMNVAWHERTYARIDAADDLSCRPDFSIMIYPWESVTEAPVNADPSQATAPNVTKETPPTMLVQAEDDPVHMENALFYFLALKQKGAAASELHIYPRGGHGYGRCTINTADEGFEVCTWPERGHLFLQTLGVAAA